MAHNNNIGRITSGDVAPKGTGADLRTTTDSGSILGLRYIKDSTTGGSSGTGPAPTDIGSLAIKNWFETYVGTLGTYTPPPEGDTDIKWSNYQGSTILGMKLQTCNESTSTYQDSNNAKIKVTPLNGNGANGTYTIKVGGSTITGGGGNRGTTSGGFSSGQSVAVELTDQITGTRINMTWTTTYNQDIPSIRGSGTVAGPQYQWFFNGSQPFPGAGVPFSSNELYFFSGVQNSNRMYGAGYPSTG